MELLRKQIIGWADDAQPWQRDLLRRVARGPLTDEGREEVLRIVLGTETAPTPQPLQERDLVGADEPAAPVSLVAIRDVGGIDALASDQNLRFEPTGLTVVYGNNGSGKSGFGRILRVVCQAITVPGLRSNAFEPAPVAQTARVKALRAGSQEDVRLDLGAAPPDWLSAIKVFDGECAHKYVSDGDTVDHVPEPLGALSRCADEQGAIAEILRSHAAAISTATEITAKTNVEMLLLEAALSDAEAATLKSLEEQLALLDEQKLEESIATSREHAAAATRLTERLQTTADGLGDAPATRLATSRADHALATAALEQLRSGALGGQPVAGTGTEPWRAMWEAARTFVADDFPPNQGRPCPLCQREINRETEERLTRLEQFVTGDLEARVVTAQRHEQQALNALPDPNEFRSEAVRDLATLDEDLRETVLDDIEALALRRAALFADTASTPHDVERTLTQLRERAADQTARVRQHEALRSEQQRETINAEVEAFRSRKETIAEAGQLRDKHAFLSAAARLDTRAITHRHNELARLAISERLVGAVRTELERLGSLTDRVEAVTSGSKGRTVLRVRLKKATARPGHILSEGEHRAVALAFFLAQIAESGGSSGIVFDDPVSSLDHLWREQIAERLAEEAAHRQVIVFTHDLAFLAQLNAAAIDADVPFSQRFLEREKDRAGIVVTDPPFRQVAFSVRAQHLRRQVERNLLPLWENNRARYDERAERWVTDLRKTWEMLVEEGLLRGVVRRYDPRVYTPKLKLVHFPDGAVDKIVTAFGRLSRKAHHEAAGVSHAPSPEKLLERLDEFERLVDELGLASTDESAGADDIAA